MSRTSKQTLLLSSLGLVAILGLTGFRHEARGPEERNAMISKRLDKILEKIEATPEQATQIRAIRDELLAQAPERGRDRSELLDFWKEAQPDAAKIHAAIDQRSEAHRAFANRMADAMLQVHAILTPEQRAQVAELMAKRGHHRKGPGMKGERGGKGRQQ